MIHLKLLLLDLRPLRGEKFANATGVGSRGREGLHPVRFDVLLALPVSFRYRLGDVFGVFVRAFAGVACSVCRLEFAVHVATIGDGFDVVCGEGHW